MAKVDARLGPLPAEFLKRLRGQAVDAEALIEALNGPRVNSIRVSPRLTKSALAGLPGVLGPVPWCPSGWYVSHTAHLGRHPLHAAGGYYVQEPSAMAVAEAANPRPGCAILDLSAAPGGKATHLAQLAGPEALIVANDVTPARAAVLAGNFDRLGLPGVVTSASVGALAEKWGARFDLVLLDAPCSGEGMMRRDLDARRQWTPRLVAACARTQADLMPLAAELVKPGGKLVYSTCTFSVEENEGVLEAFLLTHPHFRLREAPEHVARYADPGGLPGALRFWPHHQQGEGTFLAVLERDETGGNGERWTLEAADRPSTNELRELAALVEADDAPRSVPSRFGANIVALHADTPPLDGIRVARAGLPLAEVRPGRLEPAHGLSHWLDQRALQRLELDVFDPEVSRFLRGEQGDAEGQEGWVNVTTGGLGLGWGKASHGRLKNHYPKNLREV